VTKCQCETHYREWCKTVCKPICETHCKEVCCTVCKPVCETCYKDVCTTCYRDEVTTCYKTVCKQQCKQICECKTVTKKCGEWVCEPYCVPGKKIKDWQKEAEQFTERELVNLGLITARQIKRQEADKPAFKKYLMHGVGHPIGLDVHDVGITTKALEAGWVMTVEPGIYVRDEGFAVRLENNVLLTNEGPVDLMTHIPIEADEIESIMNGKSSSVNGTNGTNGDHAASRPGRSVALARK
jgi:hypothetical protein